ARDVIEGVRRAGDHDRSGAAWLVAEHDVLRAVIEDAADRGETPRVWRLTMSMQPFYQSYVWWREWQKAARFALDVAARAGDVEGQARMQRTLAGAHFFLEEYDVALTHLDAAQQLFEQAGMNAERALVLMNQCRVLLEAGDRTRALRLYRQAGALMRRHGMPRARASSLVVMATAFQEERPRLAVMLTRRAFAIYAGLDDDRGLALCDEVLARAALAEGRLADALAHHRSGISRLPSHDRLAHAEALIALGDILEQAGRPGEARDAWL
ncbi:tetratricopeptide repeat protein, partial [Actinoplanes cyaneus]